MKISLNERQMKYLMNEFRIHQITPEHNNIVGSYVMVLHHRQASRSVLLLTSYSIEEGLQWHADKRVPAIVIWADISTVQELEDLAS
jgi:hypothetical protein